MKFGVILFPTTTSVIRAEKYLAEQQIKIRLIPTPRRVSTVCGFCLKFNWEDKERVEAKLKEGKISNGELQFLPPRQPPKIDASAS